jgi:hypothetical protein
MLVVATPMNVSGTNSVATRAQLRLAPGGSLNGTSTLAGAGTFSWAGGAFSGAVTVGVGGGTTVSGADQKTIANINGGPTPSKLTFSSRLTIAAGTSAQHVGIDLGQSTLTLRSTTAVGNFVDLYAGKLVNSGTLTVAPGTLQRNGSGSTVNQGTVSLAAGATFLSSEPYSQAAGATLAVHLGAHGHGLLSVAAAVALHGTLAAHDDGTYNPSVGKTVQVVSSSLVTAAPTCVVTSGAGSSGRHWAASTTSSGLVLTRRPGARTHC